MKKDYSLISFIQRAKRRKIVLNCLKKAKIPKEIATECKISISNVSNALAELVKADLVFCNNPKDHYFRYYELTPKGKSLLKKISV
ncbi:MAG: winged helix-turn-helix domain-containing protein [Candidatus Pacearchaeota archaeon]|nr:winged helix-turn-helix domain-containing protein [Candidatus Pacearchaeota archaeon]